MKNSELYLRRTEAIDSEHETIKTVAEKLTSHSADEIEKTIKLCYFVRDVIQYNFYMVSIALEDFRASAVLARGKGYCVQKAVLLTALGRAVGTPKRLAFGKIKNYRLPAHLVEKMRTNIVPHHSCNQFSLNLKWISAATAFSQEIRLSSTEEQAR